MKSKGRPDLSDAPFFYHHEEHEGHEDFIVKLFIKNYTNTHVLIKQIF